MLKNFGYFLRKVNWRLRLMFGLPCADNIEILYRLNRLPLDTPSGSTFAFPWGSVTFVSASDIRGQFTEIFYQRHYAFQTSNPEPVIVDAGGNVGMSAIWFRQNYPKAKITVYEADATIAGILHKNLAAAGIADVDVQNAAVWDQDGTVTFDNRGQDKGMVSDAGTVKVRAVDLAAHLPPRVDLLKLDVEGAEYAIIRRLVETGNFARVQNFVAEFHIRHSDMDDVAASLRLLRQAGFQVTFKAEIGPWMGEADKASPFDIIGKKQVLAEVYAWR